MLFGPPLPPTATRTPPRRTTWPRMPMAPPLGAPDLVCLQLFPAVANVWLLIHTNQPWPKSDGTWCLIDMQPHRSSPQQPPGGAPEHPSRFLFLCPHPALQGSHLQRVKSQVPPPPCPQRPCRPALTPPLLPLPPSLFLKHTPGLYPRTLFSTLLSALTATLLPPSIHPLQRKHLPRPPPHLLSFHLDFLILYTVSSRKAEFCPPRAWNSVTQQGLKEHLGGAGGDDRGE